MARSKCKQQRTESIARNGLKEDIHSETVTKTFIKLPEDCKSNEEPKEITVCWIYKYIESHIQTTMIHMIEGLRKLSFRYK